MQHAGTLMYWEDPLLLEGSMEVESNAIMFRGGSKPPAAFVDSATAVIADSFDGYLNHYAYNTLVPAAVARDGYVDWARRTVADAAGAAILLRDGEAAIAAATLRFNTGGKAVVAEVELASVVSTEQGAGRYRELWSVVRRMARDSGAERLIISTQASNIRVQRAWARLGLVPLAAFDTIHAIADHGS